MKKYNCIDLFSGVGGFSLGFLKSGFFDILLSIDNNPNLSITYEKNFTKIKHLNQDILSFDDEKIQKLQKKYHFEVIIGGDHLVNGFHWQVKLVGKNCKMTAINYF